MKKLKYAGIGLLAVLLVLYGFLYLRYGGGSYYPDLSTDPVFGPDALEVVVTENEPLGNLALSRDGRLFYTIHPESRPDTRKVMEWVNGAAVPYPNADFQVTEFGTVLGLFVDARNWLWTIDHGNHGADGARLLAFDLASNEVLHDYTFSPDEAPLGSFFNDLQVSDDGRYVYVADVSFFGKNPALVVYDTQEGKARRLLEEHPSVMAQDWIVQNPIKDMVFILGAVALKPGIDGLVLSHDGEYIYYGAMTHDGLFRVPTAALHDQSLSREALAEKVERIGDKPLSDGLSIDSLNNVYITDVEHGGIAVMAPDGSLRTLIKDNKRIRWADGCSFGPDDYLYFTDSAIPDQMLRSQSHMAAAAPYYIYRFKPGSKGMPGR